MVLAGQSFAFPDWELWVTTALNDGEAHFAALPPSGSVLGLVRDVTVLDLDRNGLPEVASATRSGVLAPEEVSHVWPNTGGQFGTPQRLFAGPGLYLGGVCPADLDGDGFDDLVLVAASPSDLIGTHNLRALINDGSLSFDAANTITIAPWRFNVALADINGRAPLTLRSRTHHRVPR